MLTYTKPASPQEADLGASVVKMVNTLASIQLVVFSHTFN